ncbi:substrate-binding and VWA domain-containing protein [Sphaerisporangium sp. TRM90804]|uniref:substrate-binding and VWA domain-containing protein n=1 Tax=Sphaerisporangium sp. TRM90804 TaxID=3031113 RepID=UPI00244B03BA|nr:substrate-binding and VWA domain-containing protein [Sphaerisporangium sp. TRM90804]MDH2427803.1 substrate-binding and VWA domain-containing protein [Sphaerisporangium sp. TRM90804]
MAGRHRNPDPLGYDAWGRDTPSPRQRPAYGSTAVDRARRRVIGALAACAVLLAALAGGAYGLVSSRVGCAERPQLRVMASPEIGPALEKVARWYTENGGCATVAVRTRPSAEVADDIGARKGLTDVWVPEASVWVALARLQGAGKVLPVRPISVARSPVILAVTRETAAKLAARGGQPTWTLLVPTAQTKKRLPGAFTTLLAPNRFASGLAAVNVLNAVVAGRPDMRTIVRGITSNLKRSVLPSENALFGVVDEPRGGDPVLVSSEQAIWRFNGRRGAAPLTGLYPREGAISLDYPYVPVTTDPATREAAERFRAAVQSGPGQAVLREAGFRDTGGGAGPSMDARRGLRPQPPREIRNPDVQTTLRGLLTMRMLLADTRALLLLDVSRSMAERVPGSTATRMEATAGFAEEGVRGLPKNSDIGLWIFSTGLGDGKDFKELVPVGPVNRHGPEVVEELRGLPGRTRGGTGLYDSVLAAFRSASRSQAEGMLSTIVVFTDGRDDDTRGISRKALLATLAEEFDAVRPVTITLIGYGPGVDAGELRTIARATNGAAMVAQTFEQARQLFLQVMANRVCVDRERCATRQE